MEFSDDRVAKKNSYINQKQFSRLSQQRRIVFPRKLDCYQVWPRLDSNEDILDEENPSLNGNDVQHIMSDPRCFESETIDVSQRESKNASKDINFDKSKPPIGHSSEALSKLDGDSEKESKLNNHASCLTCPTCEKVFRSKDTMLRHKMRHAGSKPFLCDVCQAGLSSAVALKEHKTMHTQLRPYKCKTCQKSFRQNSSYRRHLIIHLETYPFECCTCNRRFSQRSYLRSHMVTHSGQKPHSCSQCGKAFAHLSDLNRHRIIHSGERPYKCDLCGSSFADSSSRRRHQKEHVHKTTKFMCKKCDVHFEKCYLLKKHLSEQHSQTSVPCKTTKHHNDKSSKIIQGKFERDLAFKSSQPFTDDNNSPVFLKTCVPNFKEGRSDVPQSLCEDMAIKKNNLPSEDHCNVMDTVQNKNIEENHEYENVNSLPVIHCVDVEETFTVNIQKSGGMLALASPEACLQPFNCNYIHYPDFSSEDYYNWLTDFVAVCKLLTLPIQSDLFNKISQVHKALTDVLANPPGLLCSKTNFKVLLNLSQVLLEVTSGHLNFMFSQLQD